MSDSQEHVGDEGAAHLYFTVIPNTVIKGMKSRGLSVYAKWLYVYLKSITGDGGVCFQGTRTIAQGAGMGLASVLRAKQELAEAGLISLVHGNQATNTSDRIRIKNIWSSNMQEFSVPVPQGNRGANSEPCTDTQEDTVPVPQGNRGANLNMFPCSTEEHPVPQGNRRRSQEEDPKDPKIPPTSPKGEDRLPEPHEEVLAYLNTLLGRRYEVCPLIKARLNGTPRYTVADCILVIDWLHIERRSRQPEWVRDYLDTETPFRPGHFDKYLQQAREWDSKGRSITSPPGSVLDNKRTAENVAAVQRAQERRQREHAHDGTRLSHVQHGPVGARRVLPAQ